MTAKDEIDNIEDQLSQIPEDQRNSEYQDIQVKDKKLDVELKEKFSKHALLITYSWLAFIALILSAKGILEALNIKFLSDTVLITLISGTSFSVIIG